MIDYDAITSVSPGPFRFEVYRDEQIRVSSTQFCGGAWSWRLCTATGEVVAQSRAYEREQDCRAALSQVRRHAADADTSAAAGNSLQ